MSMKKHAHAQMCLASVFIITKMESNQDVSSEGECVTKMWHIQTANIFLPQTWFSGISN